MFPEQNNNPFAPKQSPENTPAPDSSPDTQPSHQLDPQPSSSPFADTTTSSPQPTTEQPASPAVNPFVAVPSPVAAAHEGDQSLADQPSDVSNLTLYLVVLFSGLSVIASTSYLAWSALTHFMTKPSEFSFFDFSTFNIYVLLYLVMFTTLNVLASARLEKKVAGVGSVGGAMPTIGAIWRALLVVWGVSALVGILYSPLAASLEGSESIGTSIATDILSALVALTLIAAFFWRDIGLHKLRSTLIPTVAIVVVVAAVAATSVFVAMNPKEAEKSNDIYNYSSGFDSTESNSLDGSMMEDNYSDGYSDTED